ncbi:MAG: glycosyltransferase family 2 protein [Phycisphaeraceae bacterium]|nr:glycosyltransferase family 2 protein [Phycisphaeraceae bacterium]
MKATVHPAKPVEVHLNGTARTQGPATTTARVAVIVVTWNRREVASACVRGLAAQRFPREQMDVIVVDNASTDGTLESLAELWRPETIVDNPTDEAHEPRFEPRRSPASDTSASTRNTAGFHSLTLIRNSTNHGGCGGFNTGFAWVERALNSTDFVWLVDDDAELPPEALTHLTAAAASDPRIGLVGSRTVDISDRRTTIETTIYLDRAKGRMGDDPPPGHPQHESHRRWVRQVGGLRGDLPFTGLRDVDIVSACSLLARWSAVQKVGFWDWRYFIYCDDADWCLRFGRAGYRVVLNLDAVVFHTPWLMKLTPARIYYAQRNMVWTLQKILPPGMLRAATRRWMRTILKDSMRAAVFRRLFHAEIIRETARDIIIGRTGKTAGEGPKPIPLIEAFRQAGLFRPGARVAFLCAQGERGDATARWADAITAEIRSALAAGEPGSEPRWIRVLRNDVAAVAGVSPGMPGTIVYGGRWPSRLLRQVSLLRHRPTAVVVFDQTNDFPAVCGAWNLHVDSRNLSAAQVERDGLGPRAAFLARWMSTAVRAAWYAATIRPYSSTSRYG